MRHGSLFSGIGGFDLGFQRAGIETVWQVEIDDYCRRVLARHFPRAERFADIRDCCGVDCLDPGRWRDGDGPCGRKHHLKPVDILSGGFPCQDISNAGKRAGIDGERSGLWSEYARIIRELRPRYVVVENVAALLGRGMERVLGDLAEIGYDAEWQSIRASDVGAPHRRERIWIVAYPVGGGVREQSILGVECHCTSESLLDREDVAVTNGNGKSPRGLHAGRQNKTTQVESSWNGADVANAKCSERWALSEKRNDPDRNDAGRKEEASRTGERSQDVADTDGRRCEQRDESERSLSIADARSWWAVEPDVGRVAHGVPARVDRLRGLGNAIVPQIAEFIGRRIVEA